MERDDAVVIRSSRPGDAEAIRALLAELDDLRRDWRVFPPREGFLDEVLDRYRKQVLSGEAVHLVAERVGEVVGTAFAREHVVSRFSDARALEVSSVIVRADARKRGVGRMLVRAVCEEAVRRGIDRLDLATFVQNEEALRFWESVGFAPRYVQMVSSVDATLDAVGEGFPRE